MNCQYDEHPTDEQLTEYALMNNDNNIKAHILSCPSCSRHIKEIRSVTTIIQSLPDEEIPDNVQHNLKKSIQKTADFSSWFEFSVLRWYKNPFIIGLGITGIIVFLYIYLTLIL